MKKLNALYLFYEVFFSESRLKSVFLLKFQATSYIPSSTQNAEINQTSSYPPLPEISSFSDDPSFPASFSRWVTSVCMLIWEGRKYREYFALIAEQVIWLLATFLSNFWPEEYLQDIVKRIEFSDLPRKCHQDRKTA